MKVKPIMRQIVMMMVMIPSMMLMLGALAASDTNDVFSPCMDAKVQRFDGFSFGIAFSTKESFFLDQIQLSPCDRRLSLASKGAQLAVFRPKVDEISFLTINQASFESVSSGVYMVAFAGQQYAARSLPVLVADGTNTITNFTLVLEFQRGTLQNLYWKKFGCDSCSGDSSVCLNNEECAVPNSKCKSNGGSVDCNIGLQLTFSGTDKNLQVLNSWFEVSNLRKYSLYGLFSDVRDSITGQSGLLF